MDIEIKELVTRLDRVSILLGIATAMIFDEKLTKNDRDWFLNALAEVVYHNNPVPPLPKKI